jgi:hypothetical protein
MPPKRNCTSTKPPAPRDACIHLGDKVGTHECETCQGSVKIKLYACALHGTCTLGKKLPEIACCAQCGDYTSSRRDPDPDDGRSA